MNTMIDLQPYRDFLNQQLGEKARIEKNRDVQKAILVDSKKSLRRHEQAREIVKIAGLKTQEQLSYHIGEIATLALDSIFEDPYELMVEFVERRNKIECDLYFVRQEEKVDPMSASGGGAVDVASFALRIASWSMQHPRNRNTIILDEPLKNLSADLQEKGSAMLKEISKRLNIQFIIVTHEETLTAYADRVFKVRMNKGVSYIIEEENTNEEKY